VQELPPFQSTTLRCKHIRGVYQSLLALPLVLLGELQPLWFGLLLGEQLSVAKLAGIVLVVIGGIVLVAYK
jgi:drug/metabolite transporter (DMT)-like permease